MKPNLLLLLAAVFSVTGAFAQVPQLMNYQAVVRNSQGQPVQNTLVNFQFKIHDSSTGGNVQFTETDTATTNQFGLATVQIGADSALSSVTWGTGTKFMQVLVDIAGGTNFIDMGTTQLLSVPYALNAAHSASADNGNWNTNGNNIYNSNPGYVGIGTTTPAYIADINGTGGPRVRVFSHDNSYAGLLAQNSTRQYFAGIQGTFESASGSSSGFELYDNTANIRRLVIDTIGNMGLATSAPQNRLDVAGSIAVGSYAGNSTAPDSNSIIVPGSIGIGTNSPTVKLDIENGNSSPAFKLTDGTQGAGNVLTSDANGNASWKQGNLKADFCQQLYGQTFVLVDGVDTAADFSGGILRYNDNIGYSHGVITVPYTGLYHFDLVAEFVYVFTNTESLQIQTYINGNVYDQYFFNNISTDIKLNAGDQVVFKLQQNSGSNQTLGPFSRISCHIVN